MPVIAKATLLFVGRGMTRWLDGWGEFAGWVEPATPRACHGKNILRKTHVNGECTRPEGWFAGSPGLGGAASQICPDLIYGRHSSPNYCAMQARPA